MTTKIVSELSPVIGEDNAFALINAFPGMRLYIPKKAKDLPQVTKLLGKRTTQQLCNRHSGLSIDLPSRKRMVWIRNQWIREKRQQGVKINELIRISGVSRRHIFNILKKQK